MALTTRRPASNNAHNVKAILVDNSKGAVLFLKRHRFSLLRASFPLQVFKFFGRLPLDSIFRKFSPPFPRSLFDPTLAGSFDETIKQVERVQGFLGRQSRHRAGIRLQNFFTARGTKFLPRQTTIPYLLAPHICFRAIPVEHKAHTSRPNDAARYRKVAKFDNATSPFRPT